MWHSQSPEWLNNDNLSPQQARGNLENYIATVVGHFAGKVEFWDVVNEAFENYPTSSPAGNDWRSKLRKVEQGDPASIGQPGQPVAWERRLGPDYIELAFRAARKADPNAVLFYNDYNLDNRHKANAVYLMVKEINEKYRAETGGERNLIEVIGMQGHYHRGPVSGETNADAAFPYPVDVNNVNSTIKLFSTLPGVEIAITELDVTVGNTAVRLLTAEQERQQAIMYAKLFLIFKENSRHIRRVSIWGVNDAASWRSAGSPLLFDSELKPKEAFWAVANPAAFISRTDEYLANPKAFIDERYW